MSRKYWNTIYIDRNPDNPYEGWGWVEVTTEDTERFGISTSYPDTYTRFCKSSERFKLPNSGNLPSEAKLARRNLP